MVSFSTVFLALASVVAVSADYYVDPTTIPASTRAAWCTSEIQVCPLICLQTSTGTPKVNTCNSTTLNYGCVCSNGLQPNVSEFTLTLPYFVCQAWVQQCVASCNGDNLCQGNCTANHPCGAQSPPQSNSTSTSTAATAAATAAASSSNVIYNGLGSSATATAASSADRISFPRLEHGSVYGMMVLFGSLFAGFALML